LAIEFAHLGSQRLHPDHDAGRAPITAAILPPLVSLVPS
jgi:hypothetical protein